MHPAFDWLSLDVTVPTEWSAPTGSVAFSLLPLWLLPSFLPRLAGCRQLIAFSSTSRLTKEFSRDARERLTAKKLAAGETHVTARAAGMKLPWTLLRPTLIYGAGRDANITAIARFVKRFRCFPVARPANGLRQPVHVDDLAAAAIAAVDNPAAINQTFNVPGGETLTYRQMVERIFQSLSMRPCVVPLPLPIINFAFRLIRGTNKHYRPTLFARMNEDLVFDLGPATRALGYIPGEFCP